MRLKLIRILKVFFVVWATLLFIIFLRFHSSKDFADLEDHGELGSIIDNLNKEQVELSWRYQKLLSKLGKISKNGQLLQRVSHETKELKSSSVEDVAVPPKKDDVVLPVLLIACKRPEAVQRSLSQLVKYRPSKEKFPIIVSQDCGHQPTTDVIQSFSDQVRLIKHPNLEKIIGPRKILVGYFYIARHYKWALDQVFKEPYNGLIIVEEDLDISPDFFSYFESTWPILKADPTLYCVSAWNDNGKPELIDVEGGSSRLYRSDFFPGLGWMMTRETWEEFSPKWPKSYWDDWIRQPGQRRHRSCIRPEISRTRTFGKIGVSNGQFFDKFLKKIYLNEKNIDFSSLDLTGLMKEPYDKEFVQKLSEVEERSFMEVRHGLPDDLTGAKIVYRDARNFKKMAKAFGLMDDFKEGVPRTAYLGVVSFFYRNKRIHLVPPKGWKGYDPSWK